MALNEKFRDADHLSAPVPAGTPKSAPVRLGGLNGVTVTARGEGVGNGPGNATVWLKGGYEFEVAFAVTNFGDPIYITPANALSGTASGNSLYGHALTTKAAAAGPLTVRIAN